MQSTGRKARRTDRPLAALREAEHAAQFIGAALTRGAVDIEPDFVSEFCEDMVRLLEKPDVQIPVCYFFA
jgi:hypothetical protein